ncbi:MAG: hypothetical protein KC443_09765 [Anaerolineales bacterium]|nr:hypothetical protein [Anaerolineales bacterium]
MMTTHRLYYEDAYTHQFAANVVEQVTHEGGNVVVLDNSYFYPTSGGQPFDTGTLNGVAVINVTVRDEDGAILHWLDGEVAPGKVTAVIHWPRRFDHMQQHTGQHILSQAFIQTANAHTVSFHLGDDTVTIDLDIDQLTAAQVNVAEDLANQIIWENRPIRIRFVSLAEAQQLNLRKIPPTNGEKLRLVDIEQFDLTACGGTHVAQTGAVGLIKVVKQERIRGMVRIVFCCGQRALGDYRLKNDVVNEAAAHLTTGYTELLPAIMRLQEELKQTSRTLKKQEAALLLAEAQQLWAGAERMGETAVITQTYTDRDAQHLRGLNSHLMEHGNVVALLGLAGEKSYLLFSRSADAPGEMNRLLQAALQQLGGRGGGTAVTAQGGGPTAATTQVEQAIAHARQMLQTQLA